MARCPEFSISVQLYCKLQVLEPLKESDQYRHTFPWLMDDTHPAEMVSGALVSSKRIFYDLVMMIIQLLYGIAISILCFLPAFILLHNLRNFSKVTTWRRTPLQMLNQSIIYDEWLIKEFLHAFMIHAGSGVTKRSDGDVAAQSSFTAWQVDRLKPVGNPAAPLPLSSHLLAIIVIFFFFFF